MLGTTNMGNLDMMSIFDVIIIVCGIYSVFTGKKMKTDGQPPQWLMSRQELELFRKPKQFCEAMSKKTAIFGALCALYGVYGLLVSAVFQSVAAEWVGIIAFLACIIWFVTELNKAKREYK